MTYFNALLSFYCLLAFQLDPKPFKRVATFYRKNIKISDKMPIVFLHTNLWKFKTDVTQHLHMLKGQSHA